MERLRALDKCIIQVMEFVCERVQSVQVMGFVFQCVENIMEKGENGAYKLFPTTFSKVPFIGLGFERGENILEEEKRLFASVLKAWICLG